MKYQIGQFQYDTMHRQLTDDKGNEQQLGVKAAGVLEIFIQQPQQIISIEQIKNSVWPGRVVENDSVYLQIRNLRKALSDTAQQVAYIENRQGEGYRFVASIDEITPAQAPDTHAGHLLYAAILSGLLVGVIAYWLWSKQDNPLPIRFEPNSDFINVTTKKGDENEYYVNKHAFVFNHRLDETENYKLYIQPNTDNPKPKLIKAGNFIASSPLLNKDASQLFYLRMGTTCEIWQAQLDADLNLVSEHKLFDCAHGRAWSALTLSQNEQYLYFSHIPDLVKGESSIHSLNLTTKALKQITFPNQVGTRDIEFAFSPNHKQAVFIRMIGSESVHLMLLDVATGTVSVMYSQLNIVPSIKWTEHGILLDDSYAIYLLDPKTATKNLLLSAEQPTSVASIVDDDLYFLSGASQQVDVLLTKNHGGTIRDHISSPFLDMAYRCGGNACFFISDRSGRQQIMLDHADKFEQVTQFEQTIRIYDIEPVSSTELFYISHNQLYHLNLNTNKTEQLLSEYLVSNIATCDGKTLYITAIINGENQLLKVDDSITEYPYSATDIRMDCQTQSVYVRLKDQFDLYEFDTEKQEPVRYIEGFFDKGYTNWEAEYDQILRLVDYKVIETWQRKLKVASQDLGLQVYSIRFGLSGEWFLGYAYSGEVTIKKRKFLTRSD